MTGRKIRKPGFCTVFYLTAGLSGSQSQARTTYLWTVYEQLPVTDLKASGYLQYWKVKALVILNRPPVQIIVHPGMKRVFLYRSRRFDCVYVGKFLQKMILSEKIVHVVKFLNIIITFKIWIHPSNTPDIVISQWIQWYYVFFLKKLINLVYTGVYLIILFLLQMYALGK